MRAGHPHQVAIGAQRDLGAPSKADRHVDASDRQARKPGSRDRESCAHWRQQILNPIARDGMGVAAAELHEVVTGGGIGLAGDAHGERPRETAIAVFVGEFQGGPPFARHSGEVSGHRRTTFSCHE